MEEYIKVETKQIFIKVMKQYNTKWKTYMWDLFKCNTCYVPSQNCFISLNKAISMCWIEKELDT